MLLGLASCGVLGAGACNIVAPAYLLIHGPEKIPAQHELDKERTAVVFVDDRGNQFPRRAMRLTLASEAESLILGKGLVKDMISAQSALSAAGGDRGNDLVSIAEIGRSVGADQVIYVSIDRFTLSPDGQLFEPSLLMRVKVIDATNDRRVWPEDKAGYTLLARVGTKTGTVPTSTTERAKAEDEVARAAGADLGRLFFKHEKINGPRAPTS